MAVIGRVGQSWAFAETKAKQLEASRKIADSRRISHRDMAASQFPHYTHHPKDETAVLRPH
jgi:hypothetical protein